MAVVRERNDQKPWLVLDGEELNVLTANKEGLMALRESIDIALKFPNDEHSIEYEGVIVEDIEINKIILTEKDKHKESDEDETDGSGMKSMTIFMLIMWFIILPIAGIAFIFNILFKALN